MNTVVFTSCMHCRITLKFIYFYTIIYAIPKKVMLPTDSPSSSRRWLIEITDLQDDEPPSKTKKPHASLQNDGPLNKKQKQCVDLPQSKRQNWSNMLTLVSTTGCSQLLWLLTDCCQFPSPWRACWKRQGARNGPGPWRLITRFILWVDSQHLDTLIFLPSPRSRYSTSLSMSSTHRTLPHQGDMKILGSSR